jgi:hypothetical protein
MVAQTLPGRNITVGDGSYWGVDPAEAKQMVAKLFNGEITTDIVLNTPLTGQYAPPENTITEEKEQAAETKQQTGSKTTGQSPIKPAKPKQDTTSGTDSSNPTVIITPVDDDTETSTGKSGTGSTGTSGSGTTRTGTST